MILEACTICVGYADFLAQTIPYNIGILDRWVIVTSKTDPETIELCRKWNLKCVVTEEFYRDGQKFNKGRGINKGIDQLSHQDWILHLDADIVLPSQTRRVMRDAHLDTECIYGADRTLIKGWDEWQKFKHSGYLQHDYHCRVVFPPNLEVGTRWANEAYGYVPIGYFQMWHASSDLRAGIHVKRYPDMHHDAARGDVQHAIQWDRQKRVLLPELIVVHLESEQCKLGANWNGRTTKRFEAPKVQGQTVEHHHPARPKPHPHPHPKPPHPSAV